MSMKKIFVLGDSRTGTTSLHRFLQSAGFKSIHYYFKESGLREDNILDERSGAPLEESWDVLRRFVDGSGYDAFSDYPTRTFFRELMEHYEDAYFILSRRKDLETWQRSMTEFMGKFQFKLDIPRLSEHHIRINEEIRAVAEEFGSKFCEIDIDAPSGENAKTLSVFLELPKVMQLGRENATASYDLRRWSARITLYDVQDGDIVEYVENTCAPNKAMLSEFGWVFLVNDSSDFMGYLFGGRKWSASDCEKAIGTFRTRRNKLADDGVIYQKYVIPEKAAIYPEYLPRVFRDVKISRERPACVVADAKLPGYSYLDDVLLDVKSRGFLFFKGDSHTNWFGAYFVYHHIIDCLNAELKQVQRAKRVGLHELRAELAGYDGDISTQLSAEHRRVVEDIWKDISPGNVFEQLVRYELAPQTRKAQKTDPDPEYASWLGERPLLAFSHPNKKLPKAVIFRDSTADWLVDLLAEHFSESLFVWHKGLLYEDLIAREKPDVVLHIMAERFFAQYKSFPVFSELFGAGAAEQSEESDGQAAGSVSGKKGWRRFLLRDR